VLKNKDVVAQMEKIVADFKPADYDVTAQIKAIDTFEAKAVDTAKQASAKIEEELATLNSALQDIESARPFEQLTVSALYSCALAPFLL
jgi:F-type H+-transporting ATPase subunit d